MKLRESRIRESNGQKGVKKIKGKSEGLVQGRVGKGVLKESQRGGIISLDPSAREETTADPEMWAKKKCLTMTGSVCPSFVYICNI